MNTDDKQQAQDFTEVFQFLKTVSVVPTPIPSKMEAMARQVHRATYPLILWKFRISGLPPNASVFLDEVASDALQVLPQMLLGYTKTVHLLLRGVIENTLRFVYFYDHPIEFHQMNNKEKWYIGTDKLFDYIKSHPNHSIAEQRFDAINKAQILYSDLSASVHGRAAKDLESRASLSKVVFSPTEAAKDLQLAKKCSEAANFILSIENRSALAKFSLADRKLIFGAMAPAARTVWHNFEGAVSRDTP